MKTAVAILSQDSLAPILEPILCYLEDDSVTDILVNEDGSIWVESLNKGMFPTGKVMQKAAIDTVIRRVASRIRFELGENNPSVSSMLHEWGVRFQGQIAPAAPGGAYFSIRRHAKRVFTLWDYVDQGMLSQKQADYLAQSVAAKKNIIVGGGTGSGKTTFLNALLLEVGKTGDRCALIQEQDELQYSPDLNFIRLNIAKPEVYSGRRAVYDSLRLRPDRIIYGEVRDGAAALELLKGWNTGHSGGLATIHANSTTEMLDRLHELLMEELQQPPINLIRRAIDICIFISYDYRCGRKIAPIFEVEKPDGGHWTGKHISA